MIAGAEVIRDRTMLLSHDIVNVVDYVCNQFEPALNHVRACGYSKGAEAAMRGEVDLEDIKQPTATKRKRGDDLVQDEANLDGSP